MLYLIEAIISILSIILLLPISLLFIQSLYSTKVTTLPKSQKQQNIQAKILIPAHNEALIIKNTLSSIQPQLGENDSILVVADNCTDETANLVRSMGIDVIERYDEQNQGKSYALDYGIKYLFNEPPDVVVIIDADCDSSACKLRNLIEYSVAKNKPIQSLYFMNAPINSNIKTKIAAFAWVVKNWVRPSGFQRLGLPCHLMGSGMVFPWHIISKVNLATGSIVEDLKLGLDCMKLGAHPELYAGSIVSSEFPTDESAEYSQRTRWEHGHLSAILQEMPSYFKYAIINHDFKLFVMILDAAVPPLALISIILLSLTLLGIGFSFIGFYNSLIISSFSFSFFMISIFLSWFKFGKKIITFTELFAIPVYIISKLPLYLKFIIKKQVTWVKTKRN